MDKEQFIAVFASGVCQTIAKQFCDSWPDTEPFSWQQMDVLLDKFDPANFRSTPAKLSICIGKRGYPGSTLELKSASNDRIQMRFGWSDDCDWPTDSNRRILECGSELDALYREEILKGISSSLNFIKASDASSANKKTPIKKAIKENKSDGSRLNSKYIHINNFDLNPPNLDKLNKAIKFLNYIYKLYLKSKEIDGNTPGRGVLHFVPANDATYKNASFLIRMFHDKFNMDAVDNACNGTHYRSNEIVNSNEFIIGNKFPPSRPHGEHSIPVTQLARYIYNHVKIDSISDMADFLINSQIITAVSFSEQKTKLNIPREIGSTTSKWASKHPDFDKYNSLICDSYESVRPFLRYLGTGIEVYSMLEEKLVDIKSYTMRDHFKAINNSKSSLSVKKDFLKLVKISF